MNLSNFKEMAADFVLIKLTSGTLVLLSGRLMQCIWLNLRIFVLKSLENSLTCTQNETFRAENLEIFSPY